MTPVAAALRWGRKLSNQPVLEQTNHQLHGGQHPVRGIHTVLFTNACTKHHHVYRACLRQLNPSARNAARRPRPNRQDCLRREHPLWYVPIFFRLNHTKANNTFPTSRLDRGANNRDILFRRPRPLLPPRLRPRNRPSQRLWLRRIC